MSAIRDAGKVKARERIAVLAALNLAFAQAERPTAPVPAAAGESGRCRPRRADRARRSGARCRWTIALTDPRAPRRMQSSVAFA